MPLKKTDEAYWDELWRSGGLPPSVDTDDRSLENHVNLSLHSVFIEILQGLKTDEMELLELGCARSVWLPYFSGNFGFNVSGLDYSGDGCTQARAILKREGIEGRVFHADIFTPDETLLERFDVVVSFGVVEHFEDTAASLEAVSGFLRPGGLAITVIPNLMGILGFVQRIINRPVYDMHKLLSCEDLSAASSAAGLEGFHCRYLVPLNFGINNLNEIREGTLEWKLKRVVLAMLRRFSKLAFALDRAGLMPVPGRCCGSYVICTARKPYEGGAGV
jgi:SAM-dependent methyltransferase